MPTIAETLKARWKPEYATRVTGGSHAFETALSFVGAGAAKRAELAKPGTLSEKGIAEAVRDFAGKGVVPELRKFREQVGTERANLKLQRQALGIPKHDPADLAGALRRQEIRAYLRELPYGDRIGLLMSGKAEFVDAALEAQPELSGVSSAEHWESVLKVHREKNFAPQLAAIEEADEALALVDAAIRVAETDLKSHTGMTDQEFRQFLAA